jgi:GAF domain-containing protein/signal transduction histidine kinase
VINSKMQQVLGQAIANLQKQTHGPRTLDSSTFDEAAFARSVATNRSLEIHYLLLKPIYLYFAGDYDGASAAADAALPLPPGFFYIAERGFYRGLCVAAKLREAVRAGADDDTQARLLGELREAEKAVAGWAAACPTNHAHRHALLAAELAAATGAVDAANDLYDRAIAIAQTQGTLQLQALGNELAAGFHFTRGRTKIARAYMSEAHYAYRRWGGKAKADQIAAAYPELLAGASTQRVDSLSTSTSITSGSVPPLEASYDGSLSQTTMSGRLDLVTTIRATQAIASELDLSKLLERLMRILVENAAAQRGFLVLQRGQRLEIAAAATVDPDIVETGLHEPLEGSARLATSVVQYVARSREAAVLGNAAAADRFAHDPYVAAIRPRSLLCLPLEHQGRVTGVLYLENNAATNAFHPARVELLQFLAVQAAIAVENAKLYGDVRAATEELRRANETLEHKVEERTAELAGRNRSMRIVLDNVDQGLLTVDLDGRLLEERSAMVDRWFGPCPGRPLFAEYVVAAGGDPIFADDFALAMDTLREGILPRELCMDQMPRRFSAGARRFECSYLPIVEVHTDTDAGTGRAASGHGVGAPDGEGLLRGLLLVINDVTERLLHARDEAEQRERLAVYTALMSDRNGFLMFFDDGERTVKELARGPAGARLEPGAIGARLDDQLRALHTLKGNAAMVGLDLVAALCHQGEDEIKVDGQPRPGTLEQLGLRWSAITETLVAVTGDSAGTRTARKVDISVDELRALGAELRRGAPADQIAAKLEMWRFEPAARSLSRLAQHARVLAGRLQKGDVDVDVEGADLRLDPDRWGPLWTSLVHLVRNAVDHGLETPAERRAAGKRERSHMRLGAAVRDQSLVVEVEDDGRGIDWDAVARIAAERSLPRGTRDELLQAMLRPGFSTRDEVTGASGRGVGLSAVATIVHDLGGTIAADSVPGKGTCWRLTIPVAAMAPAPHNGSRPNVTPLAEAPAA